MLDQYLSTFQMKPARSTRDLRDPRGPSVAREASPSRGRRGALARDAFEFLGLLAKTFYSLPADVIAASIVINLLGLALPLPSFSLRSGHSSAATSTLAFLILGGVLLCPRRGLAHHARSSDRVSAMKAAWKTNVDAITRRFGACKVG
jgi:hypothetical protein